MCEKFTEFLSSVNIPTYFLEFVVIHMKYIPMKKM